jgi:23S rRNA (cytidine2498-2'-O)-methyltransferase
MTIQSAYLAKDGLLDLLLQELGDSEAVVLENLVLSTKPYKKLFFVQNAWMNPQLLTINSIKDGARQLRALAPYWAFYPTKLFRRGELILSELPKRKSAALKVLDPLPKLPLGSFTLLDETTILASTHCSSLFANGVIQFEETKFPPSRAYLKLYEILTLIQKSPQKNEVCLEIGAAPGSWTWFLAQHSKKVIACDRAPLDSKITQINPNIEFIQGDAFKLTPDTVGPIDWLFSDIICYPEKLLDYIKLWMNHKACKNFVCTLKFQGAIDFAIVKEFEKIDGSHVVHLYHNKHELTWFKLSDL